MGGAALLGNPALASAANNQYGLGPHTASWLTPFCWGTATRPGAIDVNLAAQSNAGSNALNISNLRYPIAAGAVIQFPNGGTFTVGGSPIVVNANGAAAITGTGPTITQPIGTQGNVQNGTASPFYESLSPSGINIWTHGINDADAATQDVPAWTETVRAVIARNCTSYLTQPVFNANWQGVTGTGGSWTQATPLAGGCMPGTQDQLLFGGPIVWSSTGAVAGGPSMAISVGPSFEGGVLDVFFLAPAGTNLGVTASILVDGATPPQGAVTVNTESVSTSGLLTNTNAGTTFTNTAGTLVGTGSPNFTPNDVGKLVTLTGGAGTLPPGTFVTGYTSASTVTISSTTGVTGATSCVLSQYVPMVTRLTGLAAGAHTITVNVTAKTTNNSALFLLCLGAESSNPTTPVLWCNIARTPFQNTQQKTNSLALNTASAAVIGGTATPIAGNSQEPAFQQGVQYVDVDSVIQQNPALFFDGLHFNSRGHRLMARTLFNVIYRYLTQDQLMAR